MSFTSILKSAERFVTDNSAVILTTVGVVGTVATAVLTARSTVLALDHLEEVGAKDAPFKEKVRLTWVAYLPPVMTGCGTVAAIIFANRIGSRRVAALAAAYSVSDKAFSEYRDKVKEKFGEEKEVAVRDEIAQDQVTRTRGSEDFYLEDGETLCLESYSGRYFKSSKEAIAGAVNHVNNIINHEGYASLGEFYGWLGLDRTDVSDDLGWNVDKMLDVSYHGTLTPSGKPCLAFSYDVTPIRGFHRLR